MRANSNQKILTAQKVLQLKINVKRLFTALWFWSWWTPPRCSSSSSWSSLSPVWLNFYIWYVFNNKCELVMYYGLSCFKQLYWTFFRSSMTFMYYISSGQKRKRFFFIFCLTIRILISHLFTCAAIYSSCGHIQDFLSPFTSYTSGIRPDSGHLVSYTEL